MDNFQVKPIPDSLKNLMSPLAHDFRAALSYVSFYPINSTFVTQAVQKLHKGLQRLLQEIDPLVIHVVDEKLYLNDVSLSLEDLIQLFQDKNMRGVEITRDFTLKELTAWLQVMAFPVETRDASLEDIGHLRAISHPLVPATKDEEAGRFSSLEPPAFMATGPIDLAHETLLSFVAEAWQFSRIQKRMLGNSSEAAELMTTFDELFNRMLERMERTSPEFRNINAWFKNPEGEFLEEGIITSVCPLLEVAVNNDWHAVLFDPATEGLVNDCLGSWSAQGRTELVEKTVSLLADGLKGNPMDRQLALSHLMDARPWVMNADLVEKVLDRLNSLLATETYPGTYQSALLLAWDLVEAALELDREQPVLTLLAMLHFHADEDSSTFPECRQIARHWLYERSTPELLRHLVHCAHEAGKLDHFPLLGEMAAPMLLEDFFEAPVEEKPVFFKLFREMSDPVRSTLAEWLAGTQAEDGVRLLIPILHSCGLDAALSMQLSAWVAKGSRELKMNLIGLIEELGDPQGGPALRSALLDRDPEIAAMAAQVVGKVHFTAGVPMLIKAVRLRETRYEDNEDFLTAVCQAMGRLGQHEAVPFLKDIARKKSMLMGKNFSVELRLQAVEALSKIDDPESRRFLEDLQQERTPALKETIDRILSEKGS